MSSFITLNEILSNNKYLNKAIMEITWTIWRKKLKTPTKIKPMDFFMVFFFYILFNEVGPNQAHTAIKA